MQDIHDVEEKNILLSANKGIVFNIQKYSIHDGPGIRTVVFLKGCPLSCTWCANPESQNVKPQISYSSQRCIGCYRCVSVCPKDAITKSPNKKIIINNNICNICCICTEACLNGAIEVVGKEMTTDLILAKVERDSIFYRKSKGGVTFSGGEPFAQDKFLRELLVASKKLYLHTAVDTSGHTNWENIESSLPFVNLFLFDVKHMIPVEHLKGTGVDNKLLLGNLEKLCAYGSAAVWLRLPIIVGYNDTKENLNRLITMVNKINSLSVIQQINLLPYHKLGVTKYKKLGIKESFINMEPPSEQHVDAIRGYLTKNIPRMPVVVGG